MFPDSSLVPLISEVPSKVENGAAMTIGNTTLRRTRPQTIRLVDELGRALPRKPFSPSPSRARENRRARHKDGICGNHVATDSEEAEMGRSRWFAIFTVHQHEQKVVERLRYREIESFVPTYKEKRIWKDRHKKTLLLPLFPTYVFARLQRHDYVHVLESPSVRRIVGDSRGPVALCDEEVEFLRSDRIQERIRPYRGLAVGKKARIRSGPMAGVEGVLVRQENGWQFVVSVALINQHAEVRVPEANLEALS